MENKLKIDLCLVSLVLTSMLSNSGYALIAPFMPVELKNKGISVRWFGYIFGIYSVAVCLISPIIGHLLNKRK